MALHVNDKQNTTEQVEQPSVNMTQQGFTGGSAGEISLGFGSGLSGLMSANQGSDYTLGVAQSLIKIYDASQKNIKPKVHVLDKERFTNLAYSAVVVSLKSKDIVNYFIVLLEETGRKPLTASEVMGEWEASVKIPGSTPLIYTADDAINSILHKEIVEALKHEYGNVTYQTVDGIVLHKGHADLAVIGPMLATIAYNACYVESQIDTGNCRDLNIEKAVQAQRGNKQLRFESNMNKSVCLNEVGMPVRTDWKLDLCLVNTQNQNTVILNQANAKNVISRVGGFVDAIPENVTLQAIPGTPAVTGLRFRPQIVVTSNSAETPTMGYMLLGVASSLVMTNKNMWLAALRPTDKKVNVGALNIISKVDEGEGQRIDFTSKNYNIQQVYAGISTMFPLDPVVSVDIESFGPQSFYTSVLAAAAQPGMSDEKRGAGQAIVDCAHWLSGGRFPADFDPNEIFTNEGVVIPLGTWSDKVGDRDIRDIDLTFLAAHTDDMNVINKWVLSSLPSSASGFDPYIARVDIISKLIPTAEITGKAVRVTFTSKFITTLANSLTAAGMNVRYEPEIKFTEDANLSIMASHLSGAGIQGATGFAKEIVQAGPSYHTGYIQAGMGRY